MIKVTLLDTPTTDTIEIRLQFDKATAFRRFHDIGETLQSEDAELLRKIEKAINESA